MNTHHIHKMNLFKKEEVERKRRTGAASPRENKTIPEMAGFRGGQPVQPTM